MKGCHFINMNINKIIVIINKYTSSNFNPNFEIGKFICNMSYPSPIIQAPPLTKNLKATFPTNNPSPLHQVASLTPLTPPQRGKGKVATPLPLWGGNLEGWGKNPIIKATATFPNPKQHPFGNLEGGVRNFQ